MVRTIAIALFGLSLAFAAQAMPLSPVHQPDSIMTQARMGCGMGRSHGEWCLPVQSWHAPGAPSHAQMRTMARGRLR